jgi:hypothetical protein
MATSGHHHKKKKKKKQQQQQPQDSGGGGGGGGDDDKSKGADEGDDQSDQPVQVTASDKSDQPAGEFGLEDLARDLNSGAETADDNDKDDDTDGEDSDDDDDDDEEDEDGQGRPSVRAVLRAHFRTRAATRARKTLLEPDGGIGISRFTFSVQADQIIPQQFFDSPAPQILTGSNAPDTNFRPQRITTNVPTPGFVMLSSARVANLSLIVGGSIDAWQFNANAWDQELDLPTLTPANKASFVGMYSGLFLEPFADLPFHFIVSFSGPTTVTGLLSDGNLVTEPS